MVKKHIPELGAFSEQRGKRKSLSTHVPGIPGHDVSDYDGSSLEGITHCEHCSANSRAWIEVRLQ